MAHNSSIVSNDFIITEGENGVIDVTFTCSRDHVECSMDSCEANCHRYYTCDQIAEANDELINQGY